MCNLWTRQRRVVRSTLKQHWPTEGAASDIHRTGVLKACEESRGIPPLILNLGALEVSGQHHIPAAIAYGMETGIHLTGGWVYPKDSMDVCEKIKKPCLHWNSKPKIKKINEYGIIEMRHHSLKFQNILEKKTCNGNFPRCYFTATNFFSYFCMLS